MKMEIKKGDSVRVKSGVSDPEYFDKDAVNQLLQGMIRFTKPE